MAFVEAHDLSKSYPVATGRVQVLRDVIAARSGADDESLSASPVRAGGEFGGVQHFALEILQPGQLRNVRGAHQPVGEDEVLRVHRALRAIAAANHRVPPAG